MGLCARAKGLTDETGFDCGYLTYGTFILELIKVAYGQQCHNIFKRNMLRGAPFSDAEAEYWNAHCNDDLDILIFIQTVETNSLRRSVARYTTP